MARINFAKNFAGEIYATQTWVTGQNYATETYVDGKISGLGNVFELKGLVETLPETAEIGDVYLMNETVDGQALTAEYVYTGEKFEKLGIATSTSNYATQSYVDSNYVKYNKFISGNGVSATEGKDTDGNNTLTVEAIVSATAGNRLSLTDSGLYVPAIVASDVRGFISVDDTKSIDMDFTNGVIKGDVKKSATDGNILVINEDGLFVPNTNTDTYHTFTNTDSIEFKETGLDVTADVRIAKNQGTSNPLIIVEDDATNGGLMVQGVGLKGDAGNSFVVAKDAQTVWSAVSALDAVVNQLQGGGDDNEGIISQVTTLRTQVKKNSRNIVDLNTNINSVNETVSDIIVDNGSIKTKVNGAITDITNLETGVNNAIADIATVKGSVNGAIADIAKLEIGVNGAIADVKQVVTELADVATLKSKTVTLSKQDGVATAKMNAGEIVFAVLDANNQVYPDVDYAADGATLTANYGGQTIPDTWTVWYGKVATFTTPTTSVVDATTTEIGNLTASVVDATTTAIGDLTATTATMENIETYVDTELN